MLRQWSYVRHDGCGEETAAMEREARRNGADRRGRVPRLHDRAAHELLGLVLLADRVLDGLAGLSQRLPGVE